MLKNFDSHLKTIEAKKAKQIELKEKEEGTLEDLRRRERNLASTQGGLIANRKVGDCFSRSVSAGARYRTTRGTFASGTQPCEKQLRPTISPDTTTLL